ncbi:bifunctional 23S rRNA (guanine(2069)-N(7))-methyltransferase RlmK/23S rRNA (guanine(2445)-N(2))-methyltransferase RlmL [Methylocaldum sp.]|uniref:bifunctional 23S rRNA (guanine(2069)-N(7))-methyltransferase RlmK/23S rRNA (guanine(2445)-N(2))-methyltransferase RlmL n=1 Tax=Methylocaldum sp. TaxID=1969727 RepID=UPI002D681B04|nr:bifunctional 23S rRNA (guanine(2069)-N(7))-methyltransferase RlmK/23S rRNA (guanine(2445)-N(2))-methyltransferase RlmL [Methylocaldum sp.]HYE34919.1 bifunctional 23S rRNA (guanine(2069)-N(7))-methyltransferase RlmK/23S rRNA (guanine(2445)-N(2))-methyltransferase RlmL [Methylocaldum sp.]
MNHSQRFFATAPLGMELLLADELRALGAVDVAETRAGVDFGGELETAYKSCLWSRLANRILLPLDRFLAASPEALYEGIRRIEWSAHLDSQSTFAVDFVSSRSKINHTLFGAQKVKDGIVDYFREHYGIRPSVRLDRPDLRVNVYLDRDFATVSIDLSGESLHKRAYRREGGKAPLKENLAAAILLRAGWPKIAETGGHFIDPMCGSGTLPIEAALMASDFAPGLLRPHFGLFGWKKHDGALWRNLVNEAERRCEQGLPKLPPIVGYDVDRQAVRIALENIEHAGLRGYVHVERKAMADARPRHQFGLIAVNPPYGERLGDEKTLVPLYTELGETLKHHFSGWKATLLTGNPELAFKLGIRATRYYTLYNGALECRLFNFDIEPERFFSPREPEQLTEAQRKTREIFRKAKIVDTAEGGAEMFANRLRKNLKNLGRWARQSGIRCYRLYDADLPEYAVAVDVYQGERTWVHVQEYEAPSSIDPVKAETRLIHTVAAIPTVLEIPPEQVFLKIRRKQKGLAQYEKQAEAGRFYLVEEGGWRFWVNFEDYLDTGLFLDHRITRRMLQDWSADKRFLNLFAYTGSASVYAAKGGALSTTTVDMSRTYLDWAGRNLEVNGIGGGRHELVQADCLEWLDQPSRDKRRFDLIFLDPPTFSTSKRMQQTLDVQRDHPKLIGQCMDLLAPGGLLVFSTNCRKFKLDAEALTGLKLEDISRKTIPKDFERNPRIHYCWTISR